MTLADRVVTLLKADSAIAAICGPRVYPEDVRIAGPGAYPEAKTRAGYWLPTLAVDDGGGVAAPFGPSGSYQDRLTVWAFGEHNRRPDIGVLVFQVFTLLHRWQDTDSRALLVFGDRLGYQPDPPPDTGGMDRITFSVSGITVGIRS